MITTKEYSWVNYIKRRIKNNKNFIAIISGPTGSGKTWAALSIGEKLDENFNIVRVVFKGSALMKLVNSKELKSGAVILWDEAGIDLSSRAWQSIMNKMLNFLLQTFRHRNFILIMTAPYGDFVDIASRKLFHAEFETVTINKAKQTCTLKPKLLQYNPSNKKWYRKYLKVVKKGIGLIKIERWAIPKPSKELIDAYEKKKEIFTHSLNIDIERKLNRIEKGDEGRLTDKQTKILNYWKKGVFSQKEIAGKIGVLAPRISENVRWMRNKGFYLEDFKKSSEN